MKKILILNAIIIAMTSCTSNLEKEKGSFQKFVNRLEKSCTRKISEKDTKRLSLEKTNLQCSQKYEEMNPEKIGFTIMTDTGLLFIDVNPRELVFLDKQRP